MANYFYRVQVLLTPYKFIDGWSTWTWTWMISEPSRASVAPADEDGS